MKVELTIFLYDKKMSEDLGIKVDDMPAKLTIDTKDICAVRQVISDGETEVCKKTCLIYTRPVEAYVVDKPYAEMLEIWGV